MLTREAPGAEEETLGELKLPSSGASPAPSKAASGKGAKSGGSTAPKKPIIEEISSTPAVEEAIAEAPKMKEPVYELIDVEEPKPVLNPLLALMFPSLQSTELFPKSTKSKAELRLSLQCVPTF